MYTFPCLPHISCMYRFKCLPKISYLFVLLNNNISFSESLQLTHTSSRRHLPCPQPSAINNSVEFIGCYKYSSTGLCRSISFQHLWLISWTVNARLPTIFDFVKIFQVAFKSECAYLYSSQLRMKVPVAAYALLRFF